MGGLEGGRPFAARVFVTPGSNLSGRSSSPERRTSLAPVGGLGYYVVRPSIGSVTVQVAARILVVDDESAIARLLARLLEQQGHVCTTASSAAGARAALAESEFELMLCDVTMPGETGIELIRDVLRSHHGLAAIMVTGNDDTELADTALELGAYGYVTKPFHSTEILINVTNALRRRRLELETHAQRAQLEQTVALRTIELREALTRLQETHVDTIRRLAAAAEARDGETGRHIERMSQTCALLAARLGLGKERARSLSHAAPMHDIGKIGIPDRILRKPGPLTFDERREMQRHTEIGRHLLGGSDDELLQLAAELAWTHHERWDGAGYPRGLVGEQIPLEARIVAVADVFDALTNERVYRPAFPLEEAIRLMREGRGSQFDPRVLDSFLHAMDDVLAIRLAVAA
jgi:putative two-component system response regulator